MVGRERGMWMWMWRAWDAFREWRCFLLWGFAKVEGPCCADGLICFGSFGVF